MIFYVFLYYVIQITWIKIYVYNEFTNTFFVKATLKKWKKNRKITIYLARKYIYFPLSSDGKFLRLHLVFLLSVKTSRIYIFAEKSSEATPFYSVLLTHTSLFFFLRMVCLNLSALLKALFTLFKPQFTLSDNPSLWKISSRMTIVILWPLRAQDTCRQWATDRM